MIRKFSDSFFAPYIGGKLIFNKPKLFKYIIIPIILNIIIYLGFIVVSYYTFGNLLNYFLFNPSSFWQYILYYILALVIGMSLLFIILISFTFVLNILAAPFNELLCMKILDLFDHKFEHQKISILKETQRIIIVEIKKIIFLGILAIISFFINFLPVLSPLSFLISSFILAYYYIDYALELNKYSFKNRLIFIFKNLFSIITFGISIGIIMFIPFINLLSLPICISGASILFIKLNKEKF